MLSLIRRKLSHKQDFESIGHGVQDTIDPALLQCASNLGIGNAHEFGTNTEPPCDLDNATSVQPDFGFTPHAPSISARDIAAPQPSCLETPESFPSLTVNDSYRGCQPEPAAEENGHVDNSAIALAKDALTACSTVGPNTDLQHFPNIVRSPQDIAKYYNRCTREEVHALWQFATDYATQICKAIHDLWNNNYFEPVWFVQIECNTAWKAHSHFAGISIVRRHYCDHDPVIEPLGDENELKTLLDTLDTTFQAMVQMCLDSISEHLLDPTRPNQIWAHLSTLDQGASDSYDTEDEDDHRYTTIRHHLNEFHNDNTRDLLRIGPVREARMRKDIRAWARIASYACIKLPCKTMVIHKSKVKRHRRHRRKRDEDSHQPKMPTAADTEAKIYTTSSRTGRDPFSTLTAQEADHVWQDIVDGQRFALQGRNMDTDLWRPRDNYAGYASASSMSSGSVASVTSQTKKRRLPREEAGYTCSFPGCLKTYDRQCDLTHHQRCHRPKDTLPYPCEECDMRFPYPKDLRRHTKAHHGAGLNP